MAPPTIPASDTRDDVITIDHVVKRFGTYVAVEQADFAIKQGEFFSMLGPSGCGKTTTLRMIAGFEQPTEGRILLDGKDVSRVPPYHRNVNTVFQHYALFPHMNVADNVAFGPRSQKVPEGETQQRVKQLLDVVRLTQFAEPEARPAVGRTAAAGGAGQGARQQSRGAAAGRAARRARPQASPGDADRAQAHPA